MSGRSILTIVSCNVRGLNNLNKRQAVFNYFRKRKPTILCLQEAHITNSNSPEFLKQWKGHLFFSPGTRNSQGLITLLDPDITTANVIVAEERFLLIRCEIDGINLYVANAYAPSNSEVDKQLFLKKIQESFNTHAGEGTHKIVVGDFNTVSSNKLDIISGRPHCDGTVNAFNELISTSELFDCWRIFNPNTKEYTWKRSSPFIARRIDYILVDENMLSVGINSKIFSTPYTDHRAVEFSWEFNKFKKGPSYYKFNNSHLLNEAFKETMNAFIAEQSTIYKYMNPHDKWETLKVKMKEKSIELSKVMAHKKHIDRCEINKKLNETEQLLAHSPNDTSLVKKSDQLKLQLEAILEAERRGAAVRANIKWIEKGERNTPYFLNLEKAKRQQNIITVLETSNGTITDQHGISLELHRFYTNLYKNSTPEDPTKMFDFENDMIIPTLCKPDIDICEAEITLDEMEAALTKIKNNSAPGIDGLTAEFYKTFWPQLKFTLYDSYIYSFRKSYLSYSQSTGVTTLLHKGKNLPRNNLTNWRPITVTNTDYKIIAKVLSGRMAKVLPNIISETQFGFLKGRSAAQLLRQIDDLIAYAESNNIQGHILAVDYHKCFDSVSHKYIEHAFQKFGFPETFIKWMQILMRNGKSCINNGGWLTDFYKLEQGLKQGCS